MKPGFFLFWEVAIGFEPMNKGFADLPLKPLGYATSILAQTFQKE